MNKQFALLIMVLASFSLSAELSFAFQDGDTQVLRNSLLAPWDGPFGGVPPWKSIDSKAFVTSFEKAIELAQADINAIADQEDAPSFENTMVALENAGAALDRLERVFGVYTSNLNLGAIPDMEAKVAPMMSKCSDWVTQHEGLFKRIETIFQSEEMKTLSVAQQRLVDDQYKTFVRRGAKLSAADKKKLSKINTCLLYTSPSPRDHRGSRMPSSA